MRINPITRYWELSNDGGRTWVDTGVYADGQDGQDDLFTGVRIEEGGKAYVRSSQLDQLAINLLVFHTHLN